MSWSHDANHPVRCSVFSKDGLRWQPYGASDSTGTSVGEEVSHEQGQNDVLAEGVGTVGVAVPFKNQAAILPGPADSYVQVYAAELLASYQFQRLIVS